MTEEKKPKTKEEELLEAKEWFREKTESIKNIQTMSETRLKMLDDVRDAKLYMNAKWSWNFMTIMYYEFLELWSIVEALTFALIEEEHETPDLEREIKSFAKELKRHRPALREMTRIMTEGKEEFRRYK